MRAAASGEIAIRDMGFSPPAVPTTACLAPARATTAFMAKRHPKPTPEFSRFKQFCLSVYRHLRVQQRRSRRQGYQWRWQRHTSQPPRLRRLRNCFNGYGVYGASINSHGVKGINRRESVVSAVENLQKQAAASSGDSDEGYGVYGSSSDSRGFRRRCLRNGKCYSE